MAELDSDSDGPDDVGFSVSKQSAVERTRIESQKAKDVKKQRKAVIAKKQAWFQESKVKNSKKKVSPEAQNVTNSDPKPKKLMSAANEQSDIEMEQDDEELPLSLDPETPPKVPVVERAKTRVKVVSLDTVGRHYGTWRSDAAKYAQERFNPSGVRRIPASKWSGIVAKRQAVRSSRS